MRWVCDINNGKNRNISKWSKALNVIEKSDWNKQKFLQNHISLMFPPSCTLSFFLDLQLGSSNLDSPSFPPFHFYRSLLWPNSLDLIVSLSQFRQQSAWLIASILSVLLARVQSIQNKPQPDAINTVIAVTVFFLQYLWLLKS